MSVSFVRRQGGSSRSLFSSQRLWCRARRILAVTVSLGREASTSLCRPVFGPSEVFTDGGSRDLSRLSPARKGPLGSTQCRGPGASLPVPGRYRLWWEPVTCGRPTPGPRGATDAPSSRVTSPSLLPGPGCTLDGPAAEGCPTNDDVYRRRVHQRSTAQVRRTGWTWFTPKRLRPYLVQGHPHVWGEMDPFGGPSGKTR